MSDPITPSRSPEKRFLALDLFCGAGGVAWGLDRAGFDVVGIDIKPQPRYPFTFIRGDALTASLGVYDFIWASPPCQPSSRMCSCRPGLREKYQQLIPAIRDRLQKSGKPYIIENVQGAPLVGAFMLCGAMFGLETYRHRYFESNVTIQPPDHPKHTIPTSRAGHWKPGTFISVAGHCSPIAKAKTAMGITWMNREELAEAIPPAFSEYIGKAIRAEIDKERGE